MNNPKHILFISSWYPNRNDPTHGIFNRYFAQAAALYNKVSVLHVCSDDAVGDNLEVIETTENNIRSIHVYYKKLGRLQPLKKYRTVMNAYESGYNRIVKECGKPDLMQLNVILPAGMGVY